MRRTAEAPRLTLDRALLARCVLHSVTVFARFWSQRGSLLVSTNCTLPRSICQSALDVYPLPLNASAVDEPPCLVGTGVFTAGATLRVRRAIAWYNASRSSRGIVASAVATNA